MSDQNGKSHTHDHDGPCHHSHDDTGNGLSEFLEVDETGEDGDEISEIYIELTEDGDVCLHGNDFDLYLSPDEARQLAQALLEVADEADGQDDPMTEYATD